MKILKILGCIFLVGLGVFMVVFGERDDSPGAQLLGVVMVVGGIVGVVKTQKKSE